MAGSRAGTPSSGSSSARGTLSPSVGSRSPSPSRARLELDYDSSPRRAGRHSPSRHAPQARSAPHAMAASHSVPAGLHVAPTGGLVPTLPHSATSSAVHALASHSRRASAVSMASTFPCNQSHSAILPILTREARTRSYLIGNLGCQDAGLLGNEELSRYFPAGKVNILILTWNMNGKGPPTDGLLDDLLLPESLTYVPDIYAIGVQEGVSSSTSDVKELEVALQTTIGPAHVLLHSVALGVLHLSIFVRRDLIWFFSVPEDAVYNSRPSSINMVKTKGAVGISFSFFGTSFLFVNSHLPAHADRFKERLNEISKIANGLDLPRNLKPLKPRYVSKDVTGRFDVAFWFGDLNFRVDKPYSEVASLVKEIAKNAHPLHGTSPAYEILIKHDQLFKLFKKKGAAFNGFTEAAKITFPPTFKYIVGSSEFDAASTRVPSYTDRVLVRTKRPGHVTCNHYNCVQTIKSSDHRPVMALMEVQLRPGRDTLPLNGGLFSREVYVEALKRRAEDGEASERRASLICVIS